jgi:DNA-directed RNA polymerase specialized sigma24 family protein
MRDLDETDSLTTESEDGHPASTDGHLQAAWSASPSSTFDASSGQSSPTSSRSIADDDEFLQVAFAATEVVHRRRLVASVLEEWSFMVRWGRARAEAHRHRHLKWASVKVMRSLMTDARVSTRVSERFHRSLRRVKMRAALRSWLFIAKDALVRAAKERRDQALKGEWPSESGSDGDSDDSAKDSEVLTEDDTEALRREAWMPLRDELKILDTEERKPVIEEREESLVHEESLVPEESSGDGGFSPENKAEFEKSYDDALKAVDVAVRGVIGLWTLATPEKPTPSSGTRPSAPPAVEGLGSQAPTARMLKFDPLRVGDWLTNQEEPEVSSEEEGEVEEEEEAPSDFITPHGAAPPLSDVRPYRVFTDETGQSFVLTSSPEAGGSTHEYMSMKDWIEFASKAI